MKKLLISLLALIAMTGCSNQQTVKEEVVKPSPIVEEDRSKDKKEENNKQEDTKKDKKEDEKKTEVIKLALDKKFKPSDDFIKNFQQKNKIKFDFVEDKEKADILSVDLSKDKVDLTKVKLIKALDADTADFIGLKNLLTEEGALGLPISANVGMNFYNRTKYDDAGLKSAEEEFLDVVKNSEDFKDKLIADRPVGIDLKDAKTVISLLYADNTSLYKEGKFDVNTVKVLFNFIEKMSKKDLLELSKEKIVENFKEGITPMFMTDSSFLFDISDSKLVDEFRVSPFSGKSEKMTLHLQVLSIGKDCTNPELAEKLIREMLSYENQKAAFLGQKYMPARYSSLLELSQLESWKLGSKAIDLFTNAQVPLDFMSIDYQELVGKLQKSLEDIAMGKKSAQEAIGEY